MCLNKYKGGIINMDIVEQVKERLSIFVNLYDMLRIVDPIKKKTIILKDNQVEEVEGSCYDFFEKQKFCENCISMRAYTENDTVVKIDNKNGKIILVIATPLIFDNNRYVVELLKDISQNGKIQSQGRDTKESIQYMLNEMNEKIIRDELTGLYNKRYINERLQVDINDSVASKLPLSVIMADIDFFKIINDSYGHLIGDFVLRDFAELIQSYVRKDMDWIGRYGGEEFLIVLNNTNLDNAYKISEKIRRGIEDTILNYDGIEIKLTSSFGIYGVTTNDMNMEELLRGADKNLYAAKMSGRNKTVV